ETPSLPAERERGAHGGEQSRGQEPPAEQRTIEAGEVVGGRDERAGRPGERLPDVADVERLPGAVVARVTVCVASGDARPGVEAGGSEVQGRNDAPAHLVGERPSGRRLDDEAQRDI